MGSQTTDPSCPQFCWAVSIFYILLGQVQTPVHPGRCSKQLVTANFSDFLNGQVYVVWIQNSRPVENGPKGRETVSKAINEGVSLIVQTSNALVWTNPLTVLDKYVIGQNPHLVTNWKWWWWWRRWHLHSVSYMPGTGLYFYEFIYSWPQPHEVGTSTRST